ncbi:MAG TPA: hypothetical protein VIX91_06125 [Candidatus Acidoferrum sp.]
MSQGATLDELMKNVKEAIALQLEGENPADFGLAPNASIQASYERSPYRITATGTEELC